MGWEALAIAAAIATAALLALLASGVKRRIRVGLVAVICALAAGGLAVVLFPRPPALEPETDRPETRLAEGYASSEACRACHPREYVTWHATYHRTMTQPASAESVIGDFDDVRLEGGGVRVHLERMDGDFFATTASGPGVRVGEREEVVLVTGSHHMQVYWVATGNERVLSQVPFVYLIEAERWVPRAAAFLRPPGSDSLPETGRWNRGCVKCHTTRGVPGITDEGIVDSHALEFGISCEACHGPSADHVRQAQSPLRRYYQHVTGADDPTTVHPGDLDGPRASQVCGQCHGIWESFNVEDARRAHAEGFRYRPGDDLHETRFVVPANLVRNPDAYSVPPVVEPIRNHPSYLASRFWSDGRVRGAGREYNAVSESPCFKGEEFSCLSCHLLHAEGDDPRPLRGWANDLLAPNMETDEACLQCHPSFRNDLSTHTRHEASSTGSRCYNCHMPFTTYGLLKATRSHQVSSPDVVESLTTGRPNACNQCHLDRSLGWAAEHLNRRYGTPVPELTADQEQIAASVLWALEGDAGQRALIAWSLGWEDARQASGEDWLAPYLGHLLDDPYAAVRFIAARSLESLPEGAPNDYDFIGPARERRSAARNVIDAWSESYSGATRPELLVDTDGLDRDTFDRLHAGRDDRPLALVE